MHIKTLQSEKGFTLIEALIAMVVLSIGIFALYSMQINSIKGNSKADRLTTAATWNADQVERIVGMQYSDAPLTDTDGDGGDGNGPNFGLDDTVATDGTLTADGTFITQDGHYTLYWNVAEDVPMEKLKTIRVHVRDNNGMLSRPVTFTYVKADIF